MAGNTNKNYDKMPHFNKLGTAHQRFMPTAKPQNSKKTLLRLLGIIAEYKKSLIPAVFLTLASACVSLLIPLLTGRAINTFNIKNNTLDITLLESILFALLACYLTVWVIDTVNGIIMAYMTQNLVKNIRSGIFSKLKRLPLNFFDTRPNGDTMSRITNDVDNISTTVSQAATQLISSIFSITGSLVMMVVLSPLLTLTAITSVPLFFLLTKTISGKSRDYFLGQQEKLGELNGVIEETITGLKIVKAFNHQSKVLQRFRTINNELCGYSTKAQIWAGFMMPMMNVINNLSYSIISLAGGILSVNGTVSIGTVISFLTYSKQFGQPLNSIAGMFNSIQSALAGAERVFEIIDEAEEPAEAKHANDLTSPKGMVEFKNIYFSYSQDKPILKDISFKVNPGQVVALVGETGAGKTTIVNLLTGFYEPDSGTIAIDGINIRDITRKSLYKCFSVVLQDTCFFTDTIKGNIKYSRTDADDREIINASKLAHAHEFISRLPNGYDTLIKGTADNLSEGQRQLIAIARAILSRAPILIFDEATSSVDTKTEKEIQKAMITLMENHTSFLIAHRLSTIRDADKIIVIGKGEIIEIGTHDELMKKKGTYYNMVVNQLNGDAEIYT